MWYNISIGEIILYLNHYGEEMNTQNNDNKYFNENIEEERCQLYNTRAKAFLFGQQPWLKSTNPTVPEVIEQLDYKS